MMQSDSGPALGYQYATEEAASAAARELDRRFTGTELAGLRIYRVRWNDDYLVEAVFDRKISESRLEDARALLGETGAAVHPDDLSDYRTATQSRQRGGIIGWLRRIMEP